MSEGSDWGSPANSGQAGPDPFGGAKQPGGPFDPSHRPQADSGLRVVLIVLFVVLGVIGLGALACCGVGYWGMSKLQDELGKQYRQQIESSPEIAEHIGQIESMQMRLIDSATSDDDDELIFDIRGSKGSGQVIIDVRLADSSDPDEAFVLLLQDGTRVPLTGVKESAGDMDFRFDVDDWDIGVPDDESPEPPPDAGPPAVDLGDPARWPGNRSTALPASMTPVIPRN